MAGGEFGYRSFLIALIEEYIDGADKDGEYGSGDGVFVGLGQGSVGQKGLGAEHSRNADAEGQRETDDDAGDGMVEDGLSGQGHWVFFKCRGFFDNLSG